MRNNRPKIQQFGSKLPKRVLLMKTENLNHRNLWLKPQSHKRQIMKLTLHRSLNFHLRLQKRKMAQRNRQNLHQLWKSKRLRKRLNQLSPSRKKRLQLRRKFRLNLWPRKLVLKLSCQRKKQYLLQYKELRKLSLKLHL